MFRLSYFQHFNVNHDQKVFIGNILGQFAVYNNQRIYRTKNIFKVLFSFRRFSKSQLYNSGSVSLNKHLLRLFTSSCPFFYLLFSFVLQLNFTFFPQNFTLCYQFSQLSLLVYFATMSPKLTHNDIFFYSCLNH